MVCNLVQYEFLAILTFEEIEGGTKSDARNSDLIRKFFQIHFLLYNSQHKPAVSNGGDRELEQLHRMLTATKCDDFGFCKRNPGHAVLQHIQPPKRTANRQIPQK